MTKEQISDEKQMIQKALLSFEKTHGRPVSVCQPQRILDQLFYVTHVANQIGQASDEAALRQISSNQKTLQCSLNWKGNIIIIADEIVRSFSK